MKRVYKIGLIFYYSAVIGCSGVNFSEWHFPYMMKVQQGNYITETQFKQLKIGMTKDQVAIIISTPVSQFLFNQNEWQIFYQVYKNQKLQNSYKINLFFDKTDKLSQIHKDGKLFLI